MSQHESGSLVVGVDVGGPKKGFHAVALQDGQYFEQFSTLRTMKGDRESFSHRAPQDPFT
jgi:hypothetical protein